MSKKLFHHIYIEILNTCNLSCSFCPPCPRSPRIMTVDEFRHAAATVKPFTDHICLHVKGEPLMHPHLGDILTIAHDAGLMVNLTTNATLLGEKGTLLLGSNAPRQVSLSLHSFDANTMHLQDFDSYLNQAIAFGKTFVNCTEGFISYRLWNLDQCSNDDQRSRNQMILQKLELSYPDAGIIESRLQKFHGNALAKRTYLNFDQLFDWPSLQASDYGSKGTCHGLRRQLAILVDGTVVPCCLDDAGVIRLGNIFTEKLSDILAKEKSLRIIEGFQKHQLVEPLCRHCGYRTRF